MTIVGISTNYLMDGHMTMTESSSPANSMKIENFMEPKFKSWTEKQRMKFKDLFTLLWIMVELQMSSLKIMVLISILCCSREMLPTLL